MIATDSVASRIWWTNSKWVSWETALGSGRSQREAKWNSAPLGSAWILPAKLLRRNRSTNGTGGLRFRSRADQIGHRVANGSPPLQYFFAKCRGARRHNDAEIGRGNSLHASAQYNEYNERYDSKLFTAQHCEYFSALLYLQMSYRLYWIPPEFS